MPAEPITYVIDTNIVAAGLITADADSPTALILDAMLSGEIMYFLSEDLLNEYSAVLRRPKLSRLHKLNDDDIDALLTEVVANAIWREPATSEQAPDPGDSHLWALLASHSGSVLVTGDRLLLENPPDEHSVISARGLVDSYLSGCE